MSKSVAVRLRTVCEGSCHAWVAGGSVSIVPAARRTGRAVERSIHQRAAVEAVRGQRATDFALRAMIRPITIRVGKLLNILLDRANEWV